MTIKDGKIVKVTEEVTKFQIATVKEFADELRSHYPHSNSVLKRIDAVEAEFLKRYGN